MDDGRTDRQTDRRTDGRTANYDNSSLEPSAQMKTPKRHQKLQFHNDCGPTYDGQLE